MNSHAGKLVAGVGAHRPTPRPQVGLVVAVRARGAGVPRDVAGFLAGAGLVLRVRRAVGVEDHHRLAVAEIARGVRIVVRGPRRRAGLALHLDPLLGELDRLVAVHLRDQFGAVERVVDRALAGVLGHEAGMDGGPRLRPAGGDAVAILRAVGEVDGQLDEVVEVVGQRLDALLVEDPLVVGDHVVLEAPRDRPLTAGARADCPSVKSQRVEVRRPSKMSSKSYSALVADVFSSHGSRSSIHPGGPYCQMK